MMLKGDVNKVRWSPLFTVSEYSAFLSLLTSVENFKSNGCQEVCFPDPPFGPKIQTNSGNLATYLPS